MRRRHVNEHVNNEINLERCLSASCWQHFTKYKIRASSGPVIRAHIV